LHHNVLAIALAMARIAWAVLNKERNFDVKTREMASRSA
jgi:hypothetical protein